MTRGMMPRRMLALTLGNKPIKSICTIILIEKSYLDVSPSSSGISKVFNA